MVHRHFVKQEIQIIRKIATWLLCSELAACSALSEMDKVSLEQARAEHEADKVMLIDIRETREHLDGVAQGAILLPMRELTQKQSLIPKDRSQPVLFICNTQNRSKAALGKLKQEGYLNVLYVEGGMSQSAAKRWPLAVPQP